MKTKRILKIIAVVFAVLFGLTLMFGIVYTAVSEYRKQGNDSCAVVECTDNVITPGTQCNYQELGTVKSTAVAFAETPTTVTPTKGSCRYLVFAPAEAFPITLYGYNGTSKKSTVVNNNGDTISIVTYWYRDSATNELRVVAQGSISYFYAVDCNGLMLFIDYSNTDDCTAFPINAAGFSDTDNIVSQIGFGYELDQIMSNAYNSGLNYGHTAGYNEGHTAGYENGFNDGSDVGVEIGYDMGVDDGYRYGLTDGYQNGVVDGEKQGYDKGYKIGLVDGENKAVSVQLTNPISSFLQPVHDFMNTKFFGDLTYASIFNVMLFVAVALIFIKMFSGG